MPLHSAQGMTFPRIDLIDLSRSRSDGEDDEDEDDEDEDDDLPNPFARCSAVPISKGNDAGDEVSTGTTEGLILHFLQRRQQEH